MSFAIVRVEVRGSSCVRVELGNSSKIPRVSIPRQRRGNFLDNVEEMFFAIPRQCRGNFLDNFEEMFFAIPGQCQRSSFAQTNQFFGPAIVQ